MFLKAIRPVQKGVEIEENYGPTFYFRARKDRQAQLATRYWFNCACAACKQNWPLLKNLSVKLGPVQDLKPFKMATELMSEGKAVSAFRVLCRLLSSLGTEHGECPTKEYITIEDKLRTCITNMGTVRIVHT